MEKCAAIIIRDRQLLVVRKKDTAIFISPGGKIEPAESHFECLKRELLEEIGVELQRAEFFGMFVRPSAFERTSITVHAWVTAIVGECLPSAEIEEVRWINGTTRIPLGSVFSECVVPELISRDLIDG